MAAQLMATNGWWERPESMCSARARSSLPVPLSPQKYRGVGRRHLLDRATQRAHRIAHSHYAFERHRAGLLAQPPVFLLQFAHAERAAHDDREHTGIQRLVVEIRRPQTDRLHRELARVALGHRNDLGIGRKSREPRTSVRDTLAATAGSGRCPDRTGRHRAPRAAGTVSASSEVSATVTSRSAKISSSRRRERRDRSRG